MRAKVSSSLFLTFLVYFVGCASKPAVTDRAPAATANVAPNSPPSPPPTVASQSTWLYSWTNQEKALSNPKNYVAAELEHAQSCLQKIAASQSESSPDALILGCEGERTPAGPGIYACDNPFTSHDYGRTLLAMKAIAGDPQIINTVNTAHPNDGGLNRSIYSPSTIDGILYDFRPTDFGTAAIVIRSQNMIDPTQTFSLRPGSGPPKKFADHAAFKCNTQTALKDILENWGDQIDFLSLTYEGFRDPSNQGFQAMHRLNAQGIMAAVASDAVALAPASLKNRVTVLLNHIPEVKEALSDDACREAGHETMRSCLAAELYTSLVGDEGSSQNPNHSWTFPTTIKVVMSLGILSETESSALETQPQLMRYLASRFTKDHERFKRVSEAFHCMLVIKNGVQKSGFSTWTGAQ